jgi:hypothetical protein
MRIEGFSFLRNAWKLHYPADASVRSALPLVDRFVIALGDSDPDDRTEAMLQGIGSDRLMTFRTTWDPERYPANTVYAHQADLARSKCQGDWLLFLQGDEVLHEEDLPLIEEACRTYRDDPKVEGLLFRYLHFWGDHRHVHYAHNWYPREVRIIKDHPAIRPWGDAQSFKVFEDFREDPSEFRKRQGVRDLRVASVGARVFHYGGMRPPEVMARKKANSDRRYRGVGSKEGKELVPFDHGPLNYLDRFRGSHPRVMRPYIDSMDWQHRLQYEGKPDPGRKRFKHERLKYRFLGFIERKILGGHPLAGSHNYRIVRRFHSKEAHEKS